MEGLGDQIEKDEIEIVDDLGEENDEVTFKYTMTSYGADYPVDGLVKRLNEGSIEIPPFQRQYVWDLRLASRFIESLLLGLPVPGIFLSKEPETQKLLVIDGQQRLKTLQYFYGGIFKPNGREFELKFVQKQFSGLKYETLSKESKIQLDDTIIHATIVKQDQPSDGESSVYHIFERLNTGGKKLVPQEIRSCIYHGEFHELLQELNSNQSWRSIYGPVSKNMRDQELILRFFALYFDREKFKRPMKEFLNDYMGKNRHLKLQSKETLNKIFSTSIETIFKSVGVDAFKPKKTMMAAVFDAVMIGITNRLERGNLKTLDAIKTQYNALIDDGPFMEACLSHTSDEDKIKSRISKALKAFDGIQ